MLSVYWVKNERCQGSCDVLFRLSSFSVFRPSDGPDPNFWTFDFGLVLYPYALDK